MYLCVNVRMWICGIRICIYIYIYIQYVGAWDHVSYGAFGGLCVRAMCERGVCSDAQVVIQVCESTSV